MTYSSSSVLSKSGLNSWISSLGEKKCYWRDVFCTLLITNTAWYLYSRYGSLSYEKFHCNSLKSLLSKFHFWWNHETDLEEVLLVPDSRNEDVPVDAPENCPGVNSTVAGKAAACEGCPNQSLCASGEAQKPDPALAQIKKNLQDIKRKVLVLSGKGGVGKSTVAVQLGWEFQNRGFSVGLMDIDICGPSVPLMTGTMNGSVHVSGDGWTPVYVTDKLAVMSIGFLLPEPDNAIIWRGPKKNGLIKQFLMDVHWGTLDILIIDTPPGTSDEHLSVVSYLKEAVIDGALVVTTPQEVSLQDVRKEINFCKKAEIKVLGVIENMSHSVFQTVGSGGAEKMCEKMMVPYSGALPLERSLLEACESGVGIREIDPDCSAATCIREVADKVLQTIDNKDKTEG